MTRKSCLTWLFGALAVMLSIGSAYADVDMGAPAGIGHSAGAWTVYAFGNAQAVSDAFRSLYNFTASALFQSIVGFIAVLGALAVGVGGGFSPAVAKKFMAYTVGVFLVCYIFFGVGSGGPLVVRVEITDTVDNTWVSPVTVPAVVGIPASVISTAGYEITKQIEASFPIPDNMKLSGGAPFNLAASMLADASQARISNPNLASSLAYYVQDCFTVGVANGEFNPATLLTSTDFLAEIKSNRVSVYVSTLLPSGVNEVTTCKDAWTRINTAVGASPMASDYLKSASAWARTPALSVVNAAADSTASMLSNNGITDGGKLVKQSAMLATFTGAFAQTAAATGNSEFLTGMQVTQARESQTSGWIVGAEVFNRSMGYIYAVLQVFVYSIIPLVLAACLVPGLGLALAKNFGQILLWLAIWQPMLAIVNYIVLSMQMADLGGALASGAGEFGFTMTNLGVISEKTANMRAAALFIGTMVPALAWAMVKGSVDFSKFIAEGVGEKFAHSAATSMATGNYSLNQGAMDSFTANKYSTAATNAIDSGVSSNGIGDFTNKDVGTGHEFDPRRRPDISNSGQLSGGASAALGDGTGRVKGAGDADNSAAGAGYTRMAYTGANGADNQQVNTSTNLNASANASFQPGANGPVNRQGMPATGQQPAGTPAQGAATIDPAQTGSPVKVTAGGGASTGAGSSHVVTGGTVAGTQTAGQITLNTQHSNLRNDTVTRNSTANNNEQGSRTDSQTISGLAGQRDLASFMGALRGHHNQLQDKLDAERGTGSLMPASWTKPTSIENKVNQLNTSGFVENKVADIEQRTGARQERQDAERAEFEKKQAAVAAAAKAAEAGAEKAGRGAVAGYQNEAGKGAMAVVWDKAKGMGERGAEYLSAVTGMSVEDSKAALKDTATVVAAGGLAAYAAGKAADRMGLEGPARAAAIASATALVAGGTYAGREGIREGAGNVVDRVTNAARDLNARADAVHAKGHPEVAQPREAPVAPTRNAQQPQEHSVVAPQQQATPPQQPQIQPPQQPVATQELAPPQPPVAQAPTEPAAAPTHVAALDPFSGNKAEAKGDESAKAQAVMAEQQVQRAQRQMADASNLFGAVEQTESLEEAHEMGRQGQSILKA